MTTLRLNGGRELKRNRQRSVYFSRLRPSTGRRPQDESLRVKEPPTAPRIILTMQTHKQLQRHNSLQLALQQTHRVLLRWSESGGNGLPNPEAEVRETHYDPLPPDLQERVDAIVAGSPWETLTRKWYRTSMTTKALAESMCIGRRQLYADWNALLWYYRGRFEETDLHE